jgi:hypothetical protein
LGKVAGEILEGKKTNVSCQVHFSATNFAVYELVKKKKLQQDQTG